MLLTPLARDASALGSIKVVVEVRPVILNLFVQGICSHLQRENESRDGPEITSSLNCPTYRQFASHHFSI